MAFREVTDERSVGRSTPVDSDYVLPYAQLDTAEDSSAGPIDHLAVVGLALRPTKEYITLHPTLLTIQCVVRFQRKVALETCSVIHIDSIPWDPKGDPV